MESKRCTRCKEVKPLTEFYYRYDRQRFTSDCKECERTDARKWWDTHRRTTQRKHHGLSHLPEHEVWKGMIQRCTNPRSVGFPHYGGRGIDIAPEWRVSFPAFYAAVGPRPSPQHTLGRIDNEKGYWPGNVRWETRKEQSRNTRSNKFLTYQGITKTVEDWAETIGTKPQVLQSRLNNEWSVEEALTLPIAHRSTPYSPHLITFQGVTQTLAAWSRAVHLSYDAIWWRLKKGWPIEKALTTPPQQRRTTKNE